MVTKRSHINPAKALDEYQVLLAQDGDRRAFELLYKRWHPKLLRFAYRQLGDRDAARDVMQDAALTIAKSIGRVRDPSQFSSWAYTIVRRRSADYIKRAVKTRRIRTELETSPISPEPLGVNEVLSLKQALAGLPAADRRLLILFYVDGMSGPEIASGTGLPLGTVKSRLFAARAKLKSIYNINPKGDDYE